MNAQDMRAARKKWFERIAEEQKEAPPLVPDLGLVMLAYEAGWEEAQKQRAPEGEPQLPREIS